MKLQGRVFEAPNKVLCVLPRGEEEPIVFECQAILDFKPFDKRCPFPKAPQKQTKQGLVYDTEDTEFQDKIQTHSDRRVAWMILTSLSITEGLEWEKVNMAKPETWVLWEEELRDAFFSNLEIIRIQNAVFEANSLSEVAIDEARANFIRGRDQALKELTSPSSEPNSGQSGEPANGTE